MIIGTVQRRRNPRLVCLGRAELLYSMDLPPHPARILDISVEGCLLAAGTPLDLAEGLFVELAFSINQLPFRVRAQVRVVRSEKVFGFQFWQLSERSRSRLRDLVEELMERDRSRFDGAGSIELR